MCAGLVETSLRSVGLSRGDESVTDLSLVSSLSAEQQQQQLPSMMVSCCVCVCQSYGKK